MVHGASPRIAAVRSLALTTGRQRVKLLLYQ
jgi:hypothetical protein